MDVISRHFVDDISIRSRLEVVDGGKRSEFDTLRLKIFRQWSRRYELSDIVADVRHKVFKKCDISQSLSFYHIFENDCVINVLNVFPHHIVVLESDAVKMRKSSVLEIFLKTFVGIVKIVERQELAIRQTLNVYLYVSASQIGGQFGRKHLGIASGNDDIAFFVGIKTS